ncbi:MAG TPA: FtsX-like permease family protein [Gemmatimonadaceae bacterium]
MKLIQIAVRNLARYGRRTLLTASLIAIGVIAVIVFGAGAGAFKGLIVGQMTDAMLGHLQIHRRGYVASMDNLPLTLTMRPPRVEAIEKALRADPEVEAYSRRLKFSGMFSNYTQTTAIRLNGVYPEEELRTVPLLASRITQGTAKLATGDIIIPELLSTGMGVRLGDLVVVVATNRDGSVNATQLTVSGVLESATGPGGRDGYVHIDDATSLLRMDEPEISEIAVRIRHFDRLADAAEDIRGALGVTVQSGPAGNSRGKGDSGAARAPGQGGASGQPGIQGPSGQLEVHTWGALSPFHNVAVLIDVLVLSATLGLVAIVLISVMNVMLMSVYERVKEIGTIAAMGTMPGRILSMFVIEGLSLGMLGIVIGNAIAAAAILLIDAIGPTFDFGRQTGLVLSPELDPGRMFVISAVVAIVAVLGTIQPAFKASRMEPVEALRHG